MAAHKQNQYNKKILACKISQVLETTRYNDGREERGGVFPQNTLISIEGSLLREIRGEVQVKKVVMKSWRRLALSFYSRTIRNTKTHGIELFWLLNILCLCSSINYIRDLLFWLLIFACSCYLVYGFVLLLWNFMILHFLLLLTSISWGCKAYPYSFIPSSIILCKIYHCISFIAV